MNLLGYSTSLLAKSLWSRFRWGVKTCPVCGGRGFLCDTVDFNKSCEDHKGGGLPVSGEKVPYHLCVDCFFCFAPTISQWDLKTFETRIYNSDYIKVDPDYIEKRPTANAELLVGSLGEEARSITHLDYGGGNGMLSDLLTCQGWHSRSYDPFVDGELPSSQLAHIDLVTAFEVFEHVPDPNKLISDLAGNLADCGVLLFSTLVSDGHIDPQQPLDWWYAAPRNGHISLFSRRSLEVLANRHNFNIGSLSPGLHMMWREKPSWANRLFDTLSSKSCF